MVKYTLFCFAALCVAAPAMADYGRDTTTYRTSCIGDRCAVYDRNGTRVGSVTTERTGRLAVRDRDGNLRAKVTRDGDSYRVRRWRR